MRWCEKWGYVDVLNSRLKEEREGEREEEDLINGG